MTAQPVAIVTGANRGIGHEVARQLAAHNHVVYVAGRDLAAARAAADDIDGEARPVRLDVTDHDQITDTITTVTEQAGQLDVVVNNAGIHYDTWQNASDPDFTIVHEALATNLFGAWHLTLAALPLLRASGHGRIVNVSSGGGALTDMGGGLPAYRTSKVGLNALTRMLAAELAGDRILVNAICPGWVATDMGGGGGRPVSDGAAGITWAATLPDTGPTGGFFRDQKPIPW